ncbi:MAG: T9SS type A sorting domain-containing protein [Bacteroidota bacterium]
MILAPTPAAYPNPAQDQLTVNVYNPDEAEATTLDLYDLNGKLLRQEAIQLQPGNNSYELDLSELNGGIYMLRLQRQSGISVVKKVIKM